MTSDLTKLVELQAVDAELTRLNMLLAAIPKTLERIESQLAAAKKRVEDARAAIKASEATKRAHEQDIQSLNDKIAKFRSQSSSVKNNEQYKALLSEIAQAEAEIGTHEEKILEVMENAEALQGKLSEAEAALTAESAEIERQKKEVEAASAGDRKAAADAVAKAKKLRAAVEETLLATYDRIAKSRGRALAEVLEHRCTACQVMLRPQLLSNVRAGLEVVHCDTCSRIMYYIPEHNIQKVDTSASSIAHQAEREWMFVPTLGTQGAFAVFINHKGAAKMKAYDAQTGEAIAQRTEKNAVFQTIFAEELRDARNLFVDEPSLEEKFKDKLPVEVLLDMRHQLPKA
ncbi:MAG: C4-type zinc ribbon domain-containing protein [Acidobacteriota bacterium]|nr:C4-type zinc ribbon domain-containing protein [Acidobacteriota bacterium]